MGVHQSAPKCWPRNDSAYPDTRRRTGHVQNATLRAPDRSAAVTRSCRLKPSDAAALMQTTKRNYAVVLNVYDLNAANDWTHGVGVGLSGSIQYTVKHQYKFHLCLPLSHTTPPHLRLPSGARAPISNISLISPATDLLMRQRERQMKL